MDQLILICASLFLHAHYWYTVDMRDADDISEASNETKKTLFVMPAKDIQ